MAASGDRSSGRTPGARVLLTAQSVLLAILALLWWRLPLVQPAPQLTIIGVAAFAMGLQQAATGRIHPNPTVSTTYMSGTVARIGAAIPKLLAGQPQPLTFNVLIWVAFAGAAFIVGHQTGVANPVLIATPCCVVAAVALLLP